MAHMIRSARRMIASLYSLWLWFSLRSTPSGSGAKDAASTACPSIGTFELGLHVAGLYLPYAWSWSSLSCLYGVTIDWQMFSFVCTLPPQVQLDAGFGFAGGPL